MAGLPRLSRTNRGIVLAVIAPGFRQTRIGAARTGYSGFNAFAQRVFCRFFRPDAAHGFDPANGAVFDQGDAIKRIPGLFRHPYGVGEGDDRLRPPDAVPCPPLEGRRRGIRARMKVAGRRTRTASPPLLVAAPVRFRLRRGFAGVWRVERGYAGRGGNIIVRFFKGGGGPLPVRSRPRQARLRLRASGFATPDESPWHARHRRRDHGGRLGGRESELRHGPIVRPV
jgi:hypothetical protein